MSARGAGDDEASASACTGFQLVNSESQAREDCPMRSIEDADY